MHVADGRDELPHDVAGLRLTEVLLLLNALKQLSPIQKLHDQKSVQLEEEEEEEDVRDLNEEMFINTENIY